MRSAYWGMIGLALVLAPAQPLAAQTARLANGAPVPGEIKGVVERGLEIQTPRGPQVLPWETLSASTRYRYQPGFREILPRLQAGESVSIPRSEPATPVPRETRPPAHPQSSSAPAAPVTTAQAASSSGTAGQKPATSPAEKTHGATAAFPEGVFRDPKNAAVLGIAFGTEPSEVLYFGINLPVERGARPDKLFVISGDHSADKPPRSVAAVARGASTVFEDILWSGKRQGHDLEAVITVEYQGGARHSFAILMRLTASKTGARTRYVLRGADLPWGSPSKMPQPIPIFSSPTINARFIDGGRKVLANVKVGVWEILPLQGNADTRLAYEMTDEKNRTARGFLKADESDLRSKTEPWVGELSRAKEERTYDVKLSMNLGELFGNATFQKSVSVYNVK